jgi:putative restriction endonuclease
MLDAAHIIADSTGGQPVVPNGLSLCKIHHAAFDQKIIGITPDYGVRVNQDVLNEVDGPMLKFGIQGFHGQHLMKIPERRKDQPNREWLATRFEEFLGAS